MARFNLKTQLIVNLLMGAQTVLLPYASSTVSLLPIKVEHGKIIMLTDFLFPDTLSGATLNERSHYRTGNY